MSSETIIRRGAALMLLVLALTVSLEARAQSPLTYEPDDLESPQRFAFEARFGPYMPHIDESAGVGIPPSCSGSGPYAATFGDQDDFYFEAEFDWQFYDIFIGTLGLGASVGVFHATANAFEEGSCTTRSGDETGLWVLPLSLLAVIRFDVFAERWNVPIVPYGKFGLGYAFWIATDADGTATASNGDRGFGGVFGLRLGGGVMLQLDWMDRRMARTFDNQFGVNHSYIFFEYYWAWLDNFGSEEHPNVGDESWVLGLALEF